MIAVDRAAVRRVAERARIELTVAVEEQLSREFSSMLCWFDELPRESELPAPSADRVPARSTLPALREDVPTVTDPTPLLAAAPALRDGWFDLPTRRLPVEKKDETVAAPEKPLVEMSAFQQLDLRSGRVVEAGPHPAADRLLVLKVDVGEAQPRTVVAGIAPYYPDPSVLVGRTIIVVCNLVPAKLRGVMSEAMLLAAGGNEHCGLVTVQEACPPGTLVR